MAAGLFRGGLRPLSLLAGSDEGDLLLGQFFAPLVQPICRRRQGRALQEVRLLLFMALPRLQVGPQPILPHAELPVPVHPALQPPPMLDQRLMDDFDGLDGRDTLFVAPRHQQSGIRQPRYQRPPRVSQVYSPRHALCVHRARPRVDQLHHHPLDRLLQGRVFFCEPGQRLLRVLRQRPGYPTNRFIGGVDHLPAALPLPQQCQGKLQQRQIPGVVAHVGQDARHQSLLKTYTRIGRWLLDRQPQLRLAHRANLHIPLLQRGYHRRIGQRPSHKIGA